MLYLVPFIEAKVTKDRVEHHVLDRPRDRPLRTGLGVAGLSFYLVLFGAASGDVISSSFGLSVNTVIWIFRIAVFVVPGGGRARRLQALRGARVGQRPGLVSVGLSASPASSAIDRRLMSAGGWAARTSGSSA